MVERPTADRLVQAAEQAIVRENGEPTRTAVGRMLEIRLPDTAAVVTAAVLRRLAAETAGYPELITTDELGVLADQIKEAHRDQ